MMYTMDEKGLEVALLETAGSIVQARAQALDLAQLTLRLRPHVLVEEDRYIGPVNAAWSEVDAVIRELEDVGRRLDRVRRAIEV